MAVVATFIGGVGTIARPPLVGTSFESEAEITFSGTTDYATGGVLISTASLYNLNFVEEIVFLSMGPVLTSTIFAAAFDRANGKVLLYALAGTQVANAANISTIKLYVRVRGR